MTLPLAGTHVMDLGDECTVLASRMLADLGADVIRVEPITGDYVRSRPPFLDNEPGLERGYTHIRYNAGKRSLALDLTRAEAWQTVDRLAGAVDLIFAPIEPDAASAAFLDDAHLRSVAPSVGVVEAVFRRNEPEAKAVIDLLGSAAGGQMILNGFPGEPPNVPGGKLAYKQTSLAAAFAGMTLLLTKGTGESGGRITVSMQEAMMWTTIQSANENYWHWHKQRQGRNGLGNLGGRTIYPTKDNLWVSFVQHPPYWPNWVEWIAEALGQDQFRDPAWSDHRYRFAHHEESVAATATLCLTMDRDALVAEGQSRSILVVPVQTVGDISGDAHLRERGFFQEVEYPQFEKPLAVMRPPFMSSSYEVTPGRAPMLGEHSRDVLTSLCGLDDAEVDRMLDAGLVREAREEVEAG